MSSNPITTGRIGRVVYDLRHWKLTIFVAVVIGIPTLVFRFVSGRNIIVGGRSTDATFLRPATSVRRGWWNDLPGYARAGLRCAVIAGFWLWFVWPELVITLLCLELVVVGLSSCRRIRDLMHERTVLRPVWPAVAGIIGIPESEPPTRWLDIPRNYQADPTALDAEITVGLRPADADDERRVRDLVTLFNQRFGAAHHGRVDYAARLVHIRVRPGEPYCWPAVANVLGVSASEMADDWMTVPDSTDEPGSRIVITLPSDVVNNVPIREDLARTINQQFPGEWASKVIPATAQAPALVVLTHKHPPATPPTYVDFLAEHPDYQGVN